MTITVIEFMYSLAALLVYDAHVQPRKKLAPWMWEHHCFSDHVEGTDGAVAIFINTGDAPPYQPVSGAIQ
jgi:hypothetical protein